MYRTGIGQRAGMMVALVVVVGLARTAAADTSRPFKGWAVEAITAAQPVEDGLLVTTTGYGEATHLGAFTREAHALLRPDFTFEGTVVFTAANGDQLFLDLEGAFTSPTTLAGTYTVTGGTGRFSGASGTADFEGVTADGIHVSLEIEGTLEF